MPTFIKALWKAIKEFAAEWGRELVMSLIWIVSVVTIILGPPATFALYEQNKRLAEGAVPSPRDMLRGFKTYFVVSWLWFLANIVVVIVTFFSFFFYLSLETTWGIMLAGFIAIVALLWATLQLYTLPIMMWQEKQSLRLAWRNGLILLLQAPLVSILFLVITVLLWILSLGTIIVLFMGGAALISAIGCQYIHDRLDLSAEIKDQ
jgi:uncharacterized membrane protein YesL